MFTKKILTMIGSLTAILSLIGGIWAFENHYATNKRVDNEIAQVEVQVAGALQNSQIKNDYKFYQFMYDKLTQDMYNLKRQLRQNPNDEALRQDYEDVLQQRKEIKIKMEELMKSIN